MRRDRLAEKILSLVAPPDRVAAVVGDLMEDAGEQGRLWFWRSVTRIWLSLLGRDLFFAPLKMAVSSALAWFVYMVLSVILAFAGYFAVSIIWGAGYVLSNHTGVELLADILRIRFDWPPVSSVVTWWIQAAVLFAVAPFQLGRASQPYWRGHEVSLAIVTLLIWTAMARFVPFVLVGIKASPAMMPLVVMFLLLGAVAERFRPASAQP